MKDKRAYLGIDLFRFVAALLVIAIHTSPLQSYDEYADFTLTRVIARVAVPFFFMTSGFFLISRYSYQNEKRNVFLKKTGMIYAISIFLYLPLNVYTGYFKQRQLGYQMWKDLLFDGTFYHLWYLPAAMLGGAIVWGCVKKFGFKKTFFLCLLLYLIGLFGDSYYGISSKILPLKEVYQILFQIFDYTRNGILFAPIFFVLGGIIADQSSVFSVWKNLIGFAISLFLMMIEGFLLHVNKLQRHDSMYLFLIPCMYFLFRSLTYWRGKRLKYISTYALLLYLLHPMTILGVRLSAKLFGKEALILGNSLLFYFLVVIFTCIGAAVLIFLYELFWKRGKEKTYTHPRKDRSWVEIDLQNLLHNARVLQQAMPKNTALMAVVKAKAYGHGDYVISTCLNKAGIRAFAVATIEEGIQLRTYGICGEILILGYTSPARAKELEHYHLTQTLIDYTYAKKLNAKGYKIKVHLKIDTGMHRLGFSYINTESIKKAFAFDHLYICGIYTHLCVSDSQKVEDVIFTQLQIKRFYEVIHQLKKDHIQVPKVHMQSSYGFLNYPNLNCDYIRVGIALYGVLSAKGDKTRLQLNLRPVLSIKSQIILLREIEKGDSVGYGRTFQAKRNSKIAILPIGYADGFPRNLSNAHANVLIRGQKAPIIGRICMDQLVVDVTDLKKVSIGDIATLLGTDQTQEISASSLADEADTISNELLSRMGSRLNIVLK